MIYLDLIFNLTLLVALSIVSIFIENHWSRRTARGVILQGLLFGGAAVLGMLHPFNLGPGLMFDGRSIMISLGALFFGPWTVLIAVVMTVVCRMLIGGVGLFTAILAILSSAGIGLYSHYRFKPWTKPPTVENLYLFGIFVHVAMLAMMFTLPGGIGPGVIKSIGLPIILMYPLATILAGKIMSDSVRTEQVIYALRDKEKLYRQMFESSNDSVFINELEDGELGKFLDVNSVACRRLGYTREELLTMSSTDITPKDMEDIRRKVVKDLSETGQNIFEIEQINKTEDRMPVEVSSRVFERGKKRYALSIARDISGRRYAESTLKRSNRYLKAISNCNQVLLKADQEKNLINDICRIICEDAGHRMVWWVGYAENDEAKTVRPIIWAGFEDNFLATANATWADNEYGWGPTGTAIRSGKTTYIQDIASDPRVIPWRKKALERGYQSSIALPLKDGTKKIFGALTIYSPEPNTFIPVEINLLEELAENMSFGITTLRARKEQRKMEDALRESEEKFRMLSEQSLLAVCFIQDDILKYANKAYCDISGYSIEEIRSWNPYELSKFVHPDDRELVMDQVRIKQSSDPDSIRHYKFKGLTKSGETKWIEMYSRTVLFQGKNASLVTFIDITERKQAEEEQKKLHAQLQQVQKMDSIGRLAGGVAHDFNNMLGVILGHTDLAMERINEKEYVQKNLMEIQKAAHHSADLTRQLLAFARKQIISPEVLDLNKNVRNMIKILSRLIGEEIDLEWLPSPKPLYVKMDTSQIDQILANICVNARDAIKGVGKVSIQTRQVRIDESCSTNNIDVVPGEYILLEVTDSGCGMDQETIGKIFEPFFTTKENGKGTGLGLSIVYGIVKQNSGFINVHSDPGKGTTFNIYLPAHMPEAKARLDDNDNAETSALLGNETIVLVEDDTSLLHLASLMLERVGYKVLTASAPFEAIKAVREYVGKIDLLITDVIMPKMNGKDLAEELVSIVPSLKCLFMSGYSDHIIAHHGVLDKGVNFMKKPFTTRILAAKVREVLDDRQGFSGTAVNH